AGAFGERGHCSMAHVPTIAEEDAKRPNRERECLVKERTRLINRMKGALRKAGNRVRITGQLIDTASGAHIWADRFDGALDDIFELQDQVASSVVGAIEPRLRQSEFERASRKPTESLDAYDLYLRALALRYQYTE